MTLNSGQKILAWALLLFCILAIPVALFSKSASSTSEDKNDKERNEKTSFAFLKKDRILVVKLAGTIYNDEDQSSIFPDPSSPSYVRKKLRRAAQDEHVKAVLLRINSPGGTVAMSQEITDAVKELKAHDKPVIASMGDVTASGGYYIASQADKIFASPGTLTGSIGVIMHLVNLSEIEKKIGISPVTIKSGQFKDIGTMDRAPTKEEVSLLNDIIMDSYDQFVTAVSEGRKMDKEAVKKLADGRIYSGRQALKVKLIDELGGYEEALGAIKSICKKKYGKDLYVDDGHSSAGMIAALLDAKMQAPKIDLFQSVLPESLNPKFSNQPLWMME
ncbi:MAG: signal peptide peptidase SppA [Candidatus Obscuribacterales bacterium]|nr:signal peptide peptidase SppA [Candidatus Obscuribacterales bacterium]